MSREDLTNFLNAAKHNLTIRRDLNQSRLSFKEIIIIAAKYGFKIPYEDIKEDKTSERAEDWFTKSRISPLKKS